MALLLFILYEPNKKKKKDIAKDHDCQTKKTRKET